MRCLILLVFISFECSAGFYLEAGVGRHGLTQDDWIGREDTGGWLGMGYIWRPEPNWMIDLGYDHMSQPGRGQPFNDQPESTNDSLTIQIRYEFNP